jgi:hypothetical protein
MWLHPQGGHETARLPFLLPGLRLTAGD